MEKIIIDASFLLAAFISIAHKIHHKQLQKENGECFGLLWMPYKYYVEQKNR